MAAATICGDSSANECPMKCCRMDGYAVVCKGTATMNDGNEIGISAGPRATINEKIIDACSPSALRAQVLGDGANSSANSITRFWKQATSKAHRICLAGAAQGTAFALVSANDVLGQCHDGY